MLVRQDPISVVVLAPAKLNLFLKVLGKRDDGYHELETLMVMVGVRDELRFLNSESTDISLSCRSAAAGSNEFNLTNGPDNLVIKAARLLQDAVGVSRGAYIELLKRIPLASGLAGGSSDAAATLVGLNRLWKLNLTRKELHPLAVRLGSDVPFFLSPSPAAICRGRGEIIEPIDVPHALHVVIARPASGLSTAEVFRHCRPAQNSRSAGDLAEALQSGRFSELAGRLYNSLQEPAEQLNPDVRKLAEKFARLPVAGHLMSGSGTGYFGICRNRRQASHVAARLRAARVGQVFVAQGRA